MYFFHLHRFLKIAFPLPGPHLCEPFHQNSFRLFSSSEIVVNSHNSQLSPHIENEVAINHRPTVQKKPVYATAFNIAAFVNKSSTLQELVKLGVNLHKIECTKGAQEVILKLDFEKDIKKYILFLSDVGVPADELGLFITKNPFIFKEDLDNLSVRINYLASKNFSRENIVRIISNNPSWLSYETLKIDDRLGYFQNKFLLKGPEVRQLTVRMPKIITCDLRHVNETYFSVKEEMGFRTSEIKELVLNKPKIFMINRKNLIERFSYLHTAMGLNHQNLIAQPGVLLCRQSRLRERHEFLVALDRAQYDPSKRGYISPLSIISGTDAEFCLNVCKVSLSTYNKFLKTLC